MPVRRPEQPPRVLTEPYHYSYTFNYLFASNGPVRPRYAGVRNSMTKIILVEESELSADDGNWHPTLVGTNVENYLAVRHGRRPPKDGVGFDDDRMGNAAFADGHGAYITRRDSRNPSFFDPRN